MTGLRNINVRVARFTMWWVWKARRGQLDGDPRMMISRSTHPKAPPGGSCLSGVPAASALLNDTVLPHHVWMVFAPIPLLSGYWRQKNIRIAETATPESNAAESTSEQRDTVSVYFTLRTDVRRRRRAHSCTLSTRRSDDGE